MPGKKEHTSKRKKEHLEICLKKEVSFKTKTTGFDKYEFEHYAPTEVVFDKINLESDFFGKRITFPFLISCMTGGTYESTDINSHLAAAAKELNIPIGAGSQRQALENKEFFKSFQIIRKKAGNVPVLGNIGAAQIAAADNPKEMILKLADMIEADAIVVHLNPLQELFQKHGDTNFSGLMESLAKICSEVSIPVIVKEVGAGISGTAAQKLLEAGVKGIDVAGAGGTSWSAVEMIRNKNYDEYFREWGLPTTYCLNEVKKLKKNYNFTLISSGGINSGIEVAKSLALGADMAASARIILKEVVENGTGGVVDLIKNWFITVRKVMYLTGADNLQSLARVKLIKTEDIY